MSEEAARERYPRNLPASHVCFRHLTAVPPLGHRWWIECIEPKVFHSEGMGAASLWHRAAEGRYCLSLLARTAEPQTVSPPQVDSIAGPISSVPHLPILVVYLSLGYTSSGHVPAISTLQTACMSVTRACRGKTVEAGPLVDERITLNQEDSSQFSTAPRDTGWPWQWGRAW